MEKKDDMPLLILIQEAARRKRTHERRAHEQHLLDECKDGILCSFFGFGGKGDMNKRAILLRVII